MQQRLVTWKINPHEERVPHSIYPPEERVPYSIFSLTSREQFAYNIFRVRRAHLLGDQKPPQQPSPAKFQQAIVASAQEFADIVRPSLSKQHFEIAEIIAMADNDLTIAISSQAYDLLTGRLRATPRYHFVTADQPLSAAAFWTVEGYPEDPHQVDQAYQKDLSLTVYDILQKCSFDGVVKYAPSGIYLESDDLMPHLDFMKKAMNQLGSEALEQLCMERQHWTSTQEETAQRSYRRLVTEIMVEKGLMPLIELF